MVKVIKKYLQDELDNLVLDAAKVHLTSAHQTFNNIENSNNYESELRVGIGHLRDCYNFYDLFLQKPIRPLGIFPGKPNKYSLESTKLWSIRNKMLITSIQIALCYKSIGDNKRLDWVGVAVINLTHFHIAFWNDDSSYKEVKDQFWVVLKSKEIDLIETIYSKENLKIAPAQAPINWALWIFYFIVNKYSKSDAINFINERCMDIYRTSYVDLIDVENRAKNDIFFTEILKKYSKK